MASEAAVREQLGQLFARLEQRPEALRSAIPNRRLLRCEVTDLGRAWYAVIDDGRVAGPSEAVPTQAPDVALSLASDDLVELVQGRLSFASALLTGRVRVRASMADMLRLRRLL